MDGARRGGLGEWGGGGADWPRQSVSTSHSLAPL